jgi:hypothetical protein
MVEGMHIARTVGIVEYANMADSVIDARNAGTAEYVSTVGGGQYAKSAGAARPCALPRRSKEQAAAPN